MLGVFFFAIAQTAAGQAANAPSEKAAEYRERAAQADELAKKASDPKVRQLLEEITRQWRALAEQAEQHDW
jgi:hypothetical protein